MTPEKKPRHSGQITRTPIRESKNETLCDVHENIDRRSTSGDANCDLREMARHEVK